MVCENCETNWYYHYSRGGTQVELPGWVQPTSSCGDGGKYRVAGMRWSFSNAPGCEWHGKREIVPTYGRYRARETRNPAYVRTVRVTSPLIASPTRSSGPEKEDEASSLNQRTVKLWSVPHLKWSRCRWWKPASVKKLKRQRSWERSGFRCCWSWSVYGLGCFSAKRVAKMFAKIFS